MGVMIDGVWHDEWYDTSSTGGRFVRKDSIYRNWITPDGAAGPSGRGGVAAAAVSAGAPGGSKDSVHGSLPDQVPDAERTADA